MLVTTKRELRKPRIVRVERGGDRRRDNKAGRNIGREIANAILRKTLTAAGTAVRKRANRGTVRVESRSAPVSIGNAVVTSRPVFRSVGARGGVGIKHSALIATIAGTPGFTVQKWQVNPGLASLFPWLSGMADRFETYSIRCTIRFVPFVGTDYTGRVWLTGKHEATEALPVYKTDLVALEGTVASPVWQRSRYTLPPMLNKNKMYVRSGPKPGQDLKTFDCGQLLVATDACADTSDIGELYLDYDVSLHNPVKASAQAISYLGNTTMPGFSSSIPFGLSGAKIQGSFGSYLLAGGSGLGFYVPGRYHVSGTMTATSFGPDIVDTALTGCVIEPGTFFAGLSTLASTVAIFRLTLDVTTTQGKIAFSYAAGIVAPISFKAFVAHASTSAELTQTAPYGP